MTGKPQTFDLNPGDMLLFNGEHVHASELNVTQDTRVVLTTRFCLKKPTFTEGGNSIWINSRNYTNF